MGKKLTCMKSFTGGDFANEILNISGIISEGDGGSGKIFLTSVLTFFYQE